MYKKVLVPILFDENHDSEGAIAIAQHLAADDGEIILMHVIEALPAYAVSRVPIEYLNSAKEAIAAELSQMAKKLPNGRAKLVEGHAGRTIVEWAEANDVDCIVIASHRPGVQDYFLGSTASRVVRHAPCSVHVLR